MTCAEAAACVGRLPVVVVSTRRRGCLRSLLALVDVVKVTPYLLQCAVFFSDS